MEDVAPLQEEEEAQVAPSISCLKIIKMFLLSPPALKAGPEGIQLSYQGQLVHLALGLGKEWKETLDSCNHLLVRKGMATIHVKPASQGIIDPLFPT